MNFLEPKKDLGGSRPKMQTQRPQQNTSHMSNRTPKVGPGAPLPAIPTGKLLRQLILLLSEVF